MGVEMRREGKDREKIEASLKILKKQAPLTLKQEKFCNDACVERFLRAKGDSVKKAAKHLRAVLSWRESIGTEHLIADEFSAELADGVAYVAGHDEEGRPIMIFRFKHDYPKLHSQKSYVRLLVFTLEVAISSMPRFVDQFVLLFDATSFCRSASAFLNLFIGTLKIIADNYPGRLHKAFVIDPPSLFSYLWKGVRPFVELSAVTSLVSSMDFDESLEEATSFSSYPRTASLRFDSPAASAAAAATAPGRAKAGGSTSSRFSFTVSHFDSLKPWYLSTTTSSRATAGATVVPSSSPSLIGVFPLNARSFSFASPTARSTPRGGVGISGLNIIHSAPSSAAPTPGKPGQQQQQQQQQQKKQQQQQAAQQPRTPMPSFLQSPAMLFSSFRKEGQSSRVERDREAFRPFQRFYRRPYDELIYRAKMRPPLGGLISIVGNASHLKQPRRTAVGGGGGYQNQQHQRV